MRLIFSTSFFPTDEKDSLPQFIREQVLWLGKTTPEIQILIVTSSRSEIRTDRFPNNVSILGFSYMLPRRLQVLTDMGIVPALRKYPASILLIPLLFIFEAIALNKAAKRFHPDYVYSHWFLPQGLINHFICQKYGNKHLFTSHSSDVEICRKLPFWGPVLVRRVLRTVHAGTAVSQRTLQSIASFFSETEWNTIRHKFKIIPMGIELPDAVLNKASQSPTAQLLCMGRLVEKKGFHILLRSFATIIEDGHPAQLTIAGSGPLEESLKKISYELRIQNHVTFAGFVTSENKRQIFLNSDLYILPSIITADGDREGLPVSLMEALSYGKICIASDGSGAEEILSSGHDGFLCTSGSQELLTDTIRRCLKMDTNEKTAMGAAARNLASRFKWENIIREHNRHFFSAASTDAI